MISETQHFDKKRVSDREIAKLQDLMLLLHEFLDNATPASRDGATIQEDTISGVPYSGFIPFQDGGYELSIYAGNPIGSGAYMSSKEREYYDRLQSDCEADYRRDKGLLMQEIINEDDYCEYENSYMEQQATIARIAAYFRESELRIVFSLNYEDAPYHRSSSDEDIVMLNMSKPLFMRASNQVIMNRLNGKKENYKREQSGFYRVS